MMVRMDTTPYAARLQKDLWAVGSAGGDEALAAAERMVSVMESSIRLVLLDALVEAAGEITEHLTPGAVEVRLLGRDVRFVVTSPSASEATASAPAAAAGPGGADQGDEDGGTARLSLRLPERLKPKVEQAAAAAGLSVNSWLVRSIAALVEPPAIAAPLPRVTTSQRRTGWAR